MKIKAVRGFKDWLPEDFVKYDFLINIAKDILKKYKEEHGYLLYHYCLMPNHIHLIIEPTLSTDLSRLMKQINLSYYNYYRNKYKHWGHFWQDRYKSLLISKDEYLITCGRYIENNPVKAKMVKNPKDYLWSSYNAYAYGKKNELIDTDPLYQELGKTESERQSSYRKYANDSSGIVKNISFNRLFLGPETFIKKMEKKFNVTNIRKNRGRPKKNK